MKAVAFKRIMALAGVLIGIPAFAQLNESDTARFQFRAGVTGAWQKGNVDLLVLRGRLELVTNSHRVVVLNRKAIVCISRLAALKPIMTSTAGIIFTTIPFEKFTPLLWYMHKPISAGKLIFDGLQVLAQPGNFFKSRQQI
jgi:hypothetical protein